MKKDGIIIQSLAPLKKEPSHKVEMVSQVFFGDHIIVEQQIMSWCRVRAGFGGAIGWIESKYFREITPSDVIHPEWVLTNSAFASPLDDHALRFQIHAGTFLPLWNREQHTFSISGQTWSLPDAKVIRLRPSPDRGQVISTANSFIGTPYLWGGVSDAGIDATGLIRTVYRIAGLSLPGTIKEIVESGREIHFSHEAKPGDLAFFSLNDSDEIIHTGMVTDSDQVLHASGRVRLDRLDAQGIFNAETGLYSHQLRIIKRLIKDE